MNKILKYLLLVIPFGIFFSCSTEPEGHVKYYLLKVDSIQHAQSVRLNDTIKIKAFGFAGYDGCHRFSHFESLSTPSSVDLKTWGKVTGTVCTLALVYFEEEYRTVAQRRGKFFINISQPDGSHLRDSVAVL